MSSIRSYKGISPQIGQGVYIDTSSVLVGDIKIGDDSSVSVSYTHLTLPTSVCV